MPAGDATAVWDDINAHLSIANIGSSGQDGVCIRRHLRAVCAIHSPRQYRSSGRVPMMSTRKPNLAPRPLQSWHRSGAHRCYICQHLRRRQIRRYQLRRYRLRRRCRQGQFLRHPGQETMCWCLTHRPGWADHAFRDSHGNYLKDTFEKEEWLLVLTT